MAFNVRTRAVREITVVGDDAAKCGSRGSVFVVYQVKARRLSDIGSRSYIVRAVTAR
jgi:hypothetical protein